MQEKNIIIGPSEREKERGERLAIRCCFRLGQISWADAVHTLAQAARLDGLMSDFKAWSAHFRGRLCLAAAAIAE